MKNILIPSDNGYLQLLIVIGEKKLNFFYILYIILTIYSFIISNIRTLTKRRQNGSQNLIYGILFILVFGHLGGGSGGGGLLYVEKKFGWSVVDYTNYRR